MKNIIKTLLLVMTLALVLLAFAGCEQQACQHTGGEATCTEKGKKQNACSVCGNVKTEDIKALGHDYKAVVTAPTCEEKGYTFLSAEVAMIPQNTVDINDPETVEKVYRFLDNLEDNDDVQEVYHNGNLPDEE